MDTNSLQLPKDRRVDWRRCMLNCTVPHFPFHREIYRWAVFVRLPFADDTLGLMVAVQKCRIKRVAISNPGRKRRQSGRHPRIVQNLLLVTLGNICNATAFSFAIPAEFMLARACNIMLVVFGNGTIITALLLLLNCDTKLLVSLVGPLRLPPVFIWLLPAVMLLFRR